MPAKPGWRRIFAALSFDQRAARALRWRHDADCVDGMSAGRPRSARASSGSPRRRS